MASTIITIADAVVEHLNDGTYSQAFTAQRYYQPTFELSDVQTLQVSVVPKSMVITPAERKKHYFECTIDIGVQQRLGPSDTESMDVLMLLVEEIIDRMRGVRLPGAPQAAPMRIALEPIFAPGHLEEWHQFTAVVSVTYRVSR